MQYSIQQIIPILSGHLIGNKNHVVEHLLLDSRQITFPSTALFFAIVGQRHDGHDYLDQLYDSGVRSFVISRTIASDKYPNAAFIKVPDTLVALQKLAQFHRHQFTLRTVGITGSNGKTIIKEWLYQLLREDFQIVRSPKSYNSQVGVPLSVWQIQPEHNLGIFEAGISEQGEMQRIAPIIDCQLGIFTNIGEAHAAGFESKEGKIREKLQLFANTQILIYCKDFELIHQEISKLGIRTFSWSKEESADLQIVNVLQDDSWLCKIEALYAGEIIYIEIPFSDEASIENAIHCWALLLKLGFNNRTIQERMKQLEPVGMRLELMDGINHCTIINDSYNTDLSSLNIALNFLEQQKQQSNKRTLILSDILQSGQDKALLYRKVAQLLAEKKINQLFAIGKDIQHIQANLDNNIAYHHHLTTNDFLASIDLTQFQNETILLKGARKFRFERIAESLSQKVHQTTLEVNLSALRHNLNVYHSFLQPKTKIMVMVKAAAYGSGSIEVARLLEFSKVDYLAVAYADEGVELRKKGIQLPILVLNPEEAVFDNLLRYRLEPEIYSLRLLEKFAQWTGDLNNPFPIHIKLETGMNRLGFTRSDFEVLAKFLHQHPQLKVESVFSHLAASEAAEHDTFTHQQVAYFKEVYEQFAKLLGYRPLRHILNSSGINRFPEYQMEMVRLGIGIYGIDSSQLISDQLQNVLKLKARISQIKTVAAGQTIGYGRIGQANTDLKIATVSIGYADGLLRAAGNRRHHLFVKGMPAFIIGNVCMDMCMLDISHIEEVKEGEVVIIFESNQQLRALATALNTIPYEVLTNISPRVKRIYIQE
jgi:alanine racemase